jgi:hypothetical protein
VPKAKATIKFLVSLVSFSLRDARGAAGVLAATLAAAFEIGFFFAMIVYFYEQFWFYKNENQYRHFSAITNFFSQLLFFDMLNKHETL